MRKLFTLVLLSGMMCLGGIDAQNIRGDFDFPWVEDIKGNGAIPGKFLRPGTQPVGWEASNVNQKVFLEKKETLVTQDANRLGGDGFSVKMENKFVGIPNVAGSNAPAYISLGTPWVFAVMDIPSCDGGTVGGVQYTQRPDSLVGYYKRTIGSEGAENALLLAYMWKGTPKSTVRTNPGGGLSSEETAVVEDQDLCILGKKTPDSGNAELIGKAEYNIEGVLADWTRISLPVEYKSDETPEKMNIILSSANYWDRSVIKNGNTLWADDVHYVYNAKLKSLTLAGEALKGFNEDIFEYQLSYADRDKELVATAYGSTDFTNVQIENESEVAGVSLVKKITVTCSNTSGQSTYVYKIIFKGEKVAIALPAEAPTFAYGDEITDFGFTSNSTEPFIYESMNDRVISVDAVSGKLKINGIGTSTIIAKQADTEGFSLAVSEPLTVTVNKATVKVSLADGAWVERGVTVSASNKTNGKCDYALVFDGFKNGETSDVLTKAVSVTAAASKTAEVVGETRPATLSAAQAKNYTFTYLPDQKFKITKTTLDVYVTYNKVKFDSNSTDVKYHKVGVPAGHVPGEFTLSYSNMKYSEKGEDIIGTNLPIVSCAIVENAPEGSEFPVTMTFPVTEFENYKLNSKLPDDAAVVVKKQITLDYEPVVGKKYGDAAFPLNVVAKVLDGEPEIKVQYTTQSTAVASVNSSTGEVTIKKPGEGKIKAYTQETATYFAGEAIVLFEVGKAPLTVNYKNVSREYGEANPELVFDSYEGFVGSDQESVVKTAPTVSCQAVATSNVGEYDIVVAGGEADNYEFVGKGKLTVTKAPLTVTAQDAARKEKEDNPVFSLSYTGFKNGENEDTKDLFVSKPEARTTALIDSPSGDYDILVVGGEAVNYNIVPVKGKLTVEPLSGIGLDSAEEITVYSKEGVIFIEGNSSLENVYIYDMQGSLVGQYNDEYVEISGLNRGDLYIVRVGSVVAKILLK
ncbi:MBG domain-containing protein [Dysgonomonas sp. 520]|uniref:MBG domain-containing protein n=1 Tax=Dysgonomonas sp. 520 TaxID=2302931 RepID=UPI0013D6F044|nr:MBG domain-containing protein [Dysgonomonas sp. 520]